MAKVVLKEIKEFYHYYPRVVAVVTARAGGKDNVMTAAWHTPLSRAPLLYGVAISPKRYTYDLVLESKEFGINFLPLEKAQLISDVGSTKGRESDKFSALSISLEKAPRTSAPILKDAYAAYECRMVDHKTYGDHEWIVGEVVAVHVEKDAFKPDGMLNLDKINPALYLYREHYLTVNPTTMKVTDKKGG